MATPQNNRDVSGFSEEPEDKYMPSGRIWFAGIGINSYEYWPHLNNAVRDMEAVADMLCNEYGVEVKTILKNEQATRRNILDLFDRLSKEVKAPDSLVIYYSGHGHLDESNKRGFLVPVDAEEKGFADLIRNSTIKDYFQDSEAQHLLLISDACFSGSLLVEKKHRDAAQRGIAELANRPSRWVMCSGRHDEAVSDGPKGGHSPFAQALLDELRYNQKLHLNAAALASEVQAACKQNYENQLADYGPIAGVGDKRGQLVLQLKIEEVDLRQINAQKAWLAIQAMPDETLKEIRLKRQRIRSFCRDYPNTEPYDDALRSGRDLEHKDEFMNNWNSEFFLLDFIRKETAYRGAAEERLEELQKIELFLPDDIHLKHSANIEKSLHPEIAAIASNMVRVEGGSFIMGCLRGRDESCSDDERPRRTARLPSFSISKFQLTQSQWRIVIGDNLSFNQDCNNCPVDNVSWDDVQRFIQKLNNLTGKLYRLPTEAEWEYAARGGNKSEGYLYSGSENLDEVGWYASNVLCGKTPGTQETTRPIGGKKPNELGLYDMSGNVWEWVEDCWHKDYTDAPVDGCAWLESNGGDCSRRILRGGSWGDATKYCRSASRTNYKSGLRDSSHGFRLAMD